MSDLGATELRLRTATHRLRRDEQTSAVGGAAAIAGEIGCGRTC